MAGGKALVPGFSADLVGPEEGVEARFEAGEAGVHVRFQTREPGIERIELEHSANHAHNDRKHGNADREIELSVRHGLTSLYWHAEIEQAETPVPPGKINSLKLMEQPALTFSARGLRLDRDFHVAVGPAALKTGAAFS